MWGHGRVVFVEESWDDGMGDVWNPEGTQSHVECMNNGAFRTWRRLSRIGVLEMGTRPSAPTWKLMASAASSAGEEPNKSV